MWSADSTTLTADQTCITADGSNVCLIGNTIWQAIDNCVNLNLIVYPDIEWETSATVPYSYTLSVVPVSGTTVSEWAVVQLTASLGPETAAATSTVPSIVGKTPYYATQALFAANCTAASPTYAYSNTVPNGLVISQSIPAGTVGAFGQYVQFVISIGPQTSSPTVVIP